MACKFRRNLDPEIRLAAPDRVREFSDAVYFPDDAKRIRVDEFIDQSPALERPILIQQDCRHVLDVQIQRETEGNDLHKRRKKHEEKRRGITPNDDEFLEQDRAEPAKWSAFHDILSRGHPERSEGPRIC